MKTIFVEVLITCFALGAFANAQYAPLTRATSPAHKGDKPKVVVIQRPKPGFMIFVKQCGRPLRIYGVDSKLYFYTLDATTLNEQQLKEIANEVDAAHRTIDEVPCVGHERTQEPANL